jgi:8-oxoguanine deaminase
MPTWIRDPLAMHLCETADEEQFCLEMYGLRPVDLLEETGWMSSRVWLAHGIHFRRARLCLRRASFVILRVPCGKKMNHKGHEGPRRTSGMRGSERDRP